MQIVHLMLVFSQQDVVNDFLDPWECNYDSKSTLSTGLRQKIAACGQSGKWTN